MVTLHTVLLPVKKVLVHAGIKTPLGFDARCVDGVVKNGITKVGLMVLAAFVV